MIKIFTVYISLNWFAHDSGNILGSCVHVLYAHVTSYQINVYPESK